MHGGVSWSRRVSVHTLLSLFITDLFTVEKEEFWQFEGHEHPVVIVFELGPPVEVAGGCLVVHH